MAKRTLYKLAIVVVLLAYLPQAVPVHAKDKWTSIRSKNFLLVGNASEKDIRSVAVRLEQFREVFSRLFANVSVNTSVPTTVVVFKNDDSYRPFKPTQNTAGYFQAGSEVNYITLRLSNDLGNEQDPFTIIFHEYTHLLVRNSTSGTVPLWFNEGLAEYYSTFSITDDQKIVVGRPIARHVYLLRDNKMLPLRKLFQVDQNSPYYNERDKQSIFYAEAWALMHYLILGNDGQRAGQVSKFVTAMSTGLSMETAFQQTFNMTFENMEKELHAYIQRDRYPVFAGTFKNKVDYDLSMQASPISEAEANAYLGDLLLKSNRAESEAYLQKALALDANLPMANASMGLLLERQGKTEDARKHFERAIAGGGQNYLIHFYYAKALSQEGNLDMETVMGFAPDTAKIMRAELKRAIELRPDFPDAYSLLAFVNLVTDNDLDGTLELLKHASAAAPNRNDLVFMLAQLYMRKQDFKTAHELIDKLKLDPELRDRAQGLLAQLNAVEEQITRAREIQQQQHKPADSSALHDGYDEAGQPAIVRKVDPDEILRESLRKPSDGETQVQGALIRIDCDQKGITFTVRVNTNTIKLNIDSFRHMDFTTFTDEAHGQITCGVRRPENNVVITYVAANDSRQLYAGVVKAIEFVPSGFKLKP